MLFAAYYFGTKNKRVSIIVPIISILIFISHPIGREVWFFTLFWTIPIIATILPNKYSMSIPLKSLGATFTAHSVGGALWIWTIPMTAGQWITLIPIVIYERLLFAAGIGISYIALNWILDKVLDIFKINIPNNILRLHKRFTLRI